MGAKFIFLLAAGLLVQAASCSRGSPSAASRSLLQEQAAGTARVVVPTDFGADPTGKSDSSAALEAAIQHALNTSTSWSLINGIGDLGSVQLDLRGGTYLLTKPLRFPPGGGGNFVVHSGTLRASPSSFPSGGYLLEMRSPAFSSGAYPYEDVTLRDVTLDCGFRGGGLRISSSLRTSVESVYISHFSSQSSGILVEGGHETYISGCFIGQHDTAGGDPGERNFGGIGIDLAGNDNVVTGCVVFSAAVGIVVRGQANLIHSTHLYNKATGFGGIGIHVRLPGLTQTRIVDSYLDFTSIVADAPNQLLVSGCFFLGDAGVVLRSTASGQSVRSVTVVANTFSGSNRGAPAVSLDESGGAFSSWSAVQVYGNVAEGMDLRSTRATMSMTGTNLTLWRLDMSPRLLLPSSAPAAVTYSLQCATPGTFPRAMLRSAANNTVVVETDIAVDATLTVTVSQTSGD